jgi:hypothetical protein
MTDLEFLEIEKHLLETLGYTSTTDKDYVNSVVHKKLIRIKKLFSTNIYAPGGLKNHKDGAMEVTRMAFLTDSLLEPLKKSNQSAWKKLTAELRDNGKSYDQFSSLKFEFLIACCFLKMNVPFDKVDYPNPDFKISNSAAGIECTSARVKTMESQSKVLEKIRDIIGAKHYKNAKPRHYANSHTALAIDITNLLFNLKAKGMKFENVKEFLASESPNIKFGSVILSDLSYIPARKLVMPFGVQVDYTAGPSAIHSWARLDQSRIHSDLKVTLDRIFPLAKEISGASSIVMDEF